MNISGGLDHSSLLAIRAESDFYYIVHAFS